MKPTYINLAVEDILSATVARKIIEQSKKDYFIVTNCFHKAGFGYLKSKIDDFNNASKSIPFFVFADQDRGCPVDKITEWLKRLKYKKHPNLLLRFAVMEIESWIMADRDSLSDYLSIDIEHIPKNPDLLPNPKEYLLSLAKRSRKKSLKEDILPAKGSTAKVGPDYNGRLSAFVIKKWNINKARQNSESLQRAFKEIKNFKDISGNSL